MHMGHMDYAHCLSTADIRVMYGFIVTVIQSELDILTVMVHYGVCS